MIHPKRYITHANEFAAHWNAVNAAINPDIRLPGNYGITSFENDRAALIDLMDALVARENDIEWFIATKERLRKELLSRFRQFNPLVRGLFPNSPQARLLPVPPLITSSPQVWMRATAEMANVWEIIDGLTPTPPGITLPLLLANGYSRWQFNADVASLLATYNSLEVALVARQSAIEARDAKWREMKTRMVQYRLTVQGRFEAGAALLESLPRLTPKYKPKAKPVQEPLTPQT